VADRLSTVGFGPRKAITDEYCHRWRNQRVEFLVLSSECAVFDHGATSALIPKLAVPQEHARAVWRQRRNNHDAHHNHQRIREDSQRRRGRPQASARADALSLPDQDLPAQLHRAGVHAPPRPTSCCCSGWPRLLLVHGRAGGATGAGRAVPQGTCGDVPRVSARCSARRKAQRRNPAAAAPLTAQSAPCGARASQTAAAAARPARHEFQRALLAARLLEPAAR